MQTTANEPSGGATRGGSSLQSFRQMAQHRRKPRFWMVDTAGKTGVVGVQESSTYDDRCAAGKMQNPDDLTEVGEPDG